MPTLFTRIIGGELPGRFVWRDPDVVAFLTIEPFAPGHTLVVPRAEVDHWIDMPSELNTKVFETARLIGQAVQRAFKPRRVGLLIAGEEVPHAHVHVIGFENVGQLSFAAVDRNVNAETFDANAEKIRAELRAMGRPEVTSA
ncbi:MAG TPA: HIT family protein [Acidimicrobiia bacterium]|jgi:histidine triad (HIT) family protein